LVTAALLTCKTKVNSEFRKTELIGVAVGGICGRRGRAAGVEELFDGGYGGRKLALELQFIKVKGGHG